MRPLDRFPLGAHVRFDSAWPCAGRRWRTGIVTEVRDRLILDLRAVVGMARWITVYEVLDDGAIMMAGAWRFGEADAEALETVGEPTSTVQEPR